jgi:hypothetical protein
VPALFSVSVDGGMEQKVVDCVVGRALASVGDGLYYIGCAPGQAKVPLLRLDLQSGKTDQLGVLEQGAGIFMGLAVSPDAKTILFAQSVRESADLMMIENFR